MKKYELDWLDNLKPGLITFLDAMKEDSVPGFYKYSLSGDLYSPSTNWGLANSVFATKIHYMIGEIEENEKVKLSSFILSFQKNNGYIYDAFLKRRSIIPKIINNIRARQFFSIKMILNEEQERAETRQSIAALAMLNKKPTKTLSILPKNEEEVRLYLESLNWNNPWGAGSHFSHLLFFLYYNRDLYDCKKNDHLIDYAIDWVSSRQSDNDGCWGKNNDSNQLKVNGVMKIITGLDAAKRLDRLKNVNKIIDTCLAAINDQEACSHFNVVYVLYTCSLLSSHRKEEIDKYVFNKLNSYRDYYYPEKGGFSFNKNKSGMNYLGAKISRGYNEPDIHGTIMFLWGITLISKVLNIDLGLREPIN